MTIDEIKKKMQELVNRWKGKPEAKMYSPEWYKRRGDRSYYERLRFLLREKIKESKSVSLPIGQYESWWNKDEADIPIDNS